VGKKDGKVVCAHELKTAGAPAKIILFPDRNKLRADGEDVSNVEVNLVDAAGVLVPKSDRLIKFEVTGPATLIGVDNGDLNSDESYQGAQRTTRRGRCLAILRTTRKAGRVGFTATAEGVSAATVYLDAK
jgi:beta-galactosidase